MSLLRLLTAGRSLVGSQNSETRYHLTRPGALPKFGGKKNPFRVTTKPEAAHSAVPADVRPVDKPAEAVVSKAVIDGPAGSQAARSAGEPAAAATPEAARTTPFVAAPAQKTKAAGALASCTGKLKSLLAVGRRRAPELPAVRASKPMVQAELSLEKVRVVRNDLSDSDLEVVTVKPRAAVSVEEPTDNRWDKVASRLFGAGKA